ncbi:MAG: ethylbenzene dehydrogenase-related protein [Candidatus Binatia bacterium]
MIRRVLTCSAAALLALTVVAPARAASRQGHGVLLHGKQVYLKNCAVCHGKRGDGNGRAAYLLYPKPRDFTRGIFKLRSTLTTPTDADLFHTITHGIPGTAMPGWSILSTADRHALVAYIKSLSPSFTEKPAAPVAIPAPPPLTAEMARAGKQLYIDAGCNSCHGPDGAGDGPSAEGLKDDWGFPIAPQDLRRADRFKAGAAPQSIYRVLAVGMGGTPMPAFGDVLTKEQSWQLVAYVRSLARKDGQEAAAAPAGPITAKRIQGPLDPWDPFAPAWKRANPVAVPLMTLWARAQTTPKLTVRALHTDRKIGFLIEWEDPNADFGGTRSQDFSDAVAIQFPLGTEPPAFEMGAKGSLVNIWQWRASKELEAAQRSVGATHLVPAVDFYPFATDPVFQPARATGNGLFAVIPPLSITEFNAEGFGTLTPQPPDDQQARGHGAWRDGKWRVVMVRSLKTDSSRDRTFAAGETVPVAFAVWDGSHHDRDGRKAVSVWQQVRVEKAP